MSGASYAPSDQNHIEVFYVVTAEPARWEG